MTTAIGPDDPDDLHIHESPRPRTLREITGLPPVSNGTHVLLDALGVRSAQRLAAGDVGGTLMLAIWPAELKTQAVHLYGKHLGRPMISTALSEGWSAEPAPQLAFWQSAAAVRLYLRPGTDALEYARRWEEEDLNWVGAYSRADLSRVLWPWLKGRSYASDADDPILDQWLGSYLGRRQAFLRPGVRLKRRCGPDDTPESLRREIDAILAAAGEPALPAR
jgi:hypothetical protein